MYSASESESQDSSLKHKSIQTNVLIGKTVQLGSLKTKRQVLLDVYSCLSREPCQDTD